MDEQQYADYLFEQYVLTPLTVSTNAEPVGQPRVSRETRDSKFHGRVDIEAYVFTVSYAFTGSEDLFRVRPSSWSMCSHDITIDEQRGMVSLQFKIYEKDPEEFKRIQAESYQNAFTNVVNPNNNANEFNRELRGLITSTILAEKGKYMRENDFFAAINVHVNPDTQSVFTPPTITKKVIPQPTPSKTKEFSSEPIMATEMYNDVLRVVYDSGKSMEKKPALYAGRDEEGLRDQFLFVLETRYEGTTASGETFNRGGKTDILLKYAKDGSNLFVAECKFWHGASEFQAAISQLFDRYLTWRDSKAALLMFVKNKDFSNVLLQIQKGARAHPLFIKSTGNRGETSFSFIFCLPQDKDKQVLFEVMVFHYDK